MTILERARDIIINPRVTWQIIKDESIDIKQLFINYAAPLALIQSIGSLIGLTIIGIRLPGGEEIVRAPFAEALLGGVAGYFLHLGLLFIAAWIIKLLAGTFGSKADLPLSVKVVVYSMTPVWLAGIFSVIPGLGILSVLGLYGIYLLFLGLPALLETPSNKVAWYAISILVAGFAVSFILSLFVFGIFYGPMFMRMMAV